MLNPNDIRFLDCEEYILQVQLCKFSPKGLYSPVFPTGELDLPDNEADRKRLKFNNILRNGLIVVISLSVVQFFRLN